MRVRTSYVLLCSVMAAGCFGLSSCHGKTGAPAATAKAVVSLSVVRHPHNAAIAVGVANGTWTGSQTQAHREINALPAHFVLARRLLLELQRRKGMLPCNI